MSTTTLQSGVCFVFFNNLPFFLVFSSSDGDGYLFVFCLPREILLSGELWESKETSALLTVGWSFIQEVSGHLTLAFDLYDPSTLQLVTFTGQHLVQVCGHLQGIQ